MTDESSLYSRYAFPSSATAPSWNPALRPDHDSPEKSSFDDAEVAHRPPQQAQGDDSYSASTRPTSIQSKEEPAVSDDDFFDRYGHPEARQTPRHEDAEAWGRHVEDEEVQHPSIIATGAQEHARTERDANTADAEISEDATWGKKVEAQHSSSTATGAQEDTQPERDATTADTEVEEEAACGKRGIEAEHSSSPAAGAQEDTQPARDATIADTEVVEEAAWSTAGDEGFLESLKGDRSVAAPEEEEDSHPSGFAAHAGEHGVLVRADLATILKPPHPKGGAQLPTLPHEPEGIKNALEEARKDSDNTVKLAEQADGSDTWGDSGGWEVTQDQDAAPGQSTEDAFNFDLGTEAESVIAEGTFAESVEASRPSRPIGDVVSGKGSEKIHVSSSLDPETAEARLSPAAVPENAEEIAKDEWGTTDESFDVGVEGPGRSESKRMGKTEDLEDAWAAVMGDDEGLLDADTAAAFDFGDDEGFLEESQDGRRPEVQNEALQHKRTMSASKYTPAGVRQADSTQQRRPTYKPEGPNFVDLSKSQAQPTPLPRGPAVSPYTSNFQQPQQVPARSAESFVDKAKSGYASPFDLPEDLTVKRVRAALRTQPSLPNLSQQMPPPPRLSSARSASAMGAPTQQSTLGRFPGGPGTPTFVTPSTVQSAAKPTDRDDGFFADLPMTTRPPRTVTPSSRYGVPSPLAPGPLGSQLQSGPPSSNYAPRAPSHQFTPQLPQTFPSEPLPTSATQAMPLSAVQASTQPGGMAQLRPAERMPLYSDEPVGHHPSVPAAPSSNLRYSPTTHPMPAKASSVTVPLSSSSSRYSPAPGAKPLPGAISRQPSESATVVPRSQAQLYAPRTSSPLAQHATPLHPQSDVSLPAASVPRSRASLDRLGSAMSTSGLETVRENAETGMHSPARPDGPNHRPPSSSRNSTPPPGTRGLAPSGLSPPRKRANYTPSANYQPMVEAMHPHVIPPKRSHTSSPNASMRFPQLQLAAVDRPASAVALQSPLQSGLPSGRPQPNRINSSLSNPAYHNMLNLFQPHDPSSQDPLERWKGAPVFRFGNGHTVVSSFPKYTPMYGGPMGQSMRPGSGDVKSQSLSELAPQSEIFTKFPGPLRKGKKKDVLAWLKSSIDSMEAEHNRASMNGEFTSALHTRSDERLLLWKLISLLVEHDGQLEGTPDIEMAVKGLLTPSIADPVSATDVSESAIQPEAFDPLSVRILRTHLYAGQRDKAVWHAVDQRLWAHALLIASTLNDKEIWKQVVQEFVRKEVRKIGENTEALAALYQVFAGNWEESVDELVSVSTRSGFQMVSKTHGSESQKDALAGLDKWRETLLLILNNRSVGDAASLAALGNLLNGYGRVEAAHVCYIFGRSVAKFGAADDQQSNFTLIGGSAALQGSEFGTCLDTILLSEVYEFALMSSGAIAAPVPHLQAYKLYHAEVLAESGQRSQAQQYCDAITGIVTAKTSRSAHYNPQLLRSIDDFAQRLSQAPLDKSGPSWKPSIDKVSSSIWGKFNNFIAGETENDEKPPVGGDMSFGQPASALGATPPLTRALSTADMYSGHQANGSVLGGTPTNGTSRYGPGNSFAPQRASSEMQRPKYASSQSTYEPRVSMESSHSNDFSNTHSPQRYAPSSSHSQGSQYAPVQQQTPSSLTTYAPEFSNSSQSQAAYMPSPLQNQSEHAYPHSLSSVPTTQADTIRAMNGHASQPALSYVPPSASVGVDVAPSAPAYEQPDDSFSAYNPPGASYEPASDSYEPPSTSYEPYQPGEAPQVGLQSEPLEPKKRSFMDDDDDDDLAGRAAKLQTDSKSAADKAADDAFKAAAEADARKAAEAKAGGRGSWFGGWFGGKKDPNMPTVYKAKLGEKSSFVYDENLKRWINKDGSSDSVPATAGTPPPPRTSAPPSRPPSGMRVPPLSRSSSTASPGPPPAGSASRPPTSSAAMQAPPAPVRTASGQIPQAGPVAALVGGAGGPPSRPPSRPSTSMSNASDIDDLLGPAAPRKGAAKGAKRKGRYVDVMAGKT